MRVYLFRHGIAFDRLDPLCPPDFERPLTERGIERTRKSARGLASLKIAPEVIVTSPLVRARETAELAAGALGFDAGAIQQSESLYPGSDPGEILDELLLAGVETAMCVGHAPNLDLVLGRAVGLSYAGITGLKKAGAACVETYTGKSGCLIWLMESKVLRRLGGS